jgi:hypothetical protein
MDQKVSTVGTNASLRVLVRPPSGKEKQLVRQLLLGVKEVKIDTKHEDAVLLRSGLIPSRVDLSMPVDVATTL